MSPRSPLLLFGASRGAGFELARLARRERRPVYAVTRAPSAALEELGVRQLSGDALDAARVAELFRFYREAGEVVSTMGGGSADGEGTINVVEGARVAGVRRFVLISSLGAGESRAFASPRLLDAIGPVLEEKTRAENHLAASGLDFTIIRPGGLKDDPPTGRAILCEDPGLHGNIPRADLAALILECLERPDTVGRTFSAVVPNVKS